MTGTLAVAPRPRQRLRPGPGARASLASGLLAFLAFPPLGWAPLSWVAWVPVLRVALRPGGTPRRAFALGWGAGVAFYALLLHWLLLLANDEVTIPGIMLPALVVLSSYLALFAGAALALTQMCARRLRVSPWLLFPIFWTTCDWLRSLGETAFPWGSWGYAFAPWTAAIQMTAWTGYWGLVVWIAAANAFVGWAWETAPKSRRAGAWALATLWILVPVVAGAWVLRASGDPAGALSPSDAGSPPPRVALLQANTPREIKWKPGYRTQVVEDLLEKTRDAVRIERPDLVVWPETAAPVRIPWEPDLSSRLVRTVDSLDTWVLVGTLDAVIEPDKRVRDYNAALLLDPGGELRGKYFKTHLVPFGEVTPLKRWLPFLAALDFGQSEFDRGGEATIFPGPQGMRFRCLICFESIFPELAREGVRGGATHLVNITNDFWFGRSAGPVQHAHMAILRAVENRTPLLRCANSGLSFFVDPWGRISRSTRLFESALPTAPVPPGRGGSFATRIGDLPIRSIALCAAALLATAFVATALERFRPRSRRGRIEPGSPPGEGVGIR